MLMLNVSDVLAFSRMLAAPNPLVMVGGVATERFALAVLPTPPLVEVTFPVVLVYCPEAAPVTVTANWHWLFTAIVAPVSAIPVGAVVVSVTLAVRAAGAWLFLRSSGGGRTHR